MERATALHSTSDFSGSIVAPSGNGNGNTGNAGTRSSGGGSGSSNVRAAASALPVTGSGSVWSGEPDGLTFTVENASVAALLTVSVDNIPLDTSEFDAREGSVILNLPAGFLETLATGEHTLRMQFWNSTATANFSVQPTATGGGSGTPDTIGSGPAANDNPNTGAAPRSGGVWLAMLVVAGSIGWTASKKR